jgi:hypothetical protein
MRRKPRGELARVVLVREQVLDRLEAVACGRAEAIEEVELRVEHRKVGGKARHADSLSVVDHATLTAS